MNPTGEDTGTTKAATRAVRAWCLYDVGNSAFATTIMAAVLPVYFSQVAAQGLAPEIATSHWGFTNSLSMALTALLAPVLGAFADAGAGRKRMLGFFALGGALTTGALVGVGPGDWLQAAILYAVARVFFASSVVMYDSLLPHVAREEEMDRVSSRGFAWGYLAGGVLLALQLVVIRDPSRFGIADTEWATRLSFLSVGVWWVAFTVPLLRHVPEQAPDLTVERAATAVGQVRDGFARLRDTFAELRRYREAFKFLVAFWLYNDGIGTIVVMAAVFGAEIGIARDSLILAILLVQFLGFPFSLLFGRLAGRIGPRNAILVGLVGYTLLCLFAWFVRTETHFFAMAVGVSMFQGGCQALSRSLFARMIPRDRSSEFFGFYDVSSKFAAIIGPALLSGVTLLTGSSRHGVFALVLLFLGGIAVLLRVDPERARRDIAEPAA